MSSILKDVKHKVGPSGDYEYFDIDLIDAINEAFAVLAQIGAGPEEGFEIRDETTEWSDYTTNITLQNLVREYVYKKAILLFDTPNNSSHIEVIKEKLLEYECRISYIVDPKR